MAVLSAGCSPKEFELAGDGRAARIVIPADALESTKLAAKELAEYVGKATGVTPAVSASAADGAATVMIGSKDYYCSLVQLEPHATLERMEFMAFPVKKSGEIDFRGPVYERRFWRAENDWDVDAATWKHFVRFFARERAEREGDFHGRA